MAERLVGLEQDELLARLDGAIELPQLLEAHRKPVPRASMRWVGLYATSVGGYRRLEALVQVVVEGFFVVGQCVAHPGRVAETGRPRQASRRFPGAREAPRLRLSLIGSSIRGGPVPFMSFLRTFFLTEVFRTLAFLLGGMQALLLHWLWVVVLGHPVPAWPIAFGILVALVAVNVALYAPLRRGRRREGMSGAVARTYMTAGVATLLLGLAVVALWAFALPTRVLLGAIGVTSDIQWGWLRFGGSGALLAAVGVIVWGATLGQARYDRTSVRLPLSGLDPSLAGLRVVQLSDLHIGNKMEGERLERLVEDVNAMQPDLMVLTGDLFDFDPDYVEEGARMLSRLQARLGVFAVLGNHDMYTGSEIVAAGLAAHAPGVRLLRAEIERLPTEAPLYLAGIDDPGRLWTDPELILEELEELGMRLPEDGPVVLLSHRPDAIEQASRLGFAAVLSGHTHGGQIALPGMAARVNLARLISRYPRGLFRIGETSLYVNRGAGVAGPAIRIAAAREIATLELTCI